MTRAIGRRRGRRIAAGFVLLLVLAGCWRLLSAAPDAGLPRAGTLSAPLDLETFFAGSSVSIGRVTTLLVFREPFIAGFVGTRAGDRFRLDERFVFPDGERLQRWEFRRTAGDRYEGSVQTERSDGSLADPVPVTGRVTGNSIVLDYRGIAPGGGTMLRFRHRLTPNRDGTVANRVTVSKFGVSLATSDVVFAKSPAALQLHLFEQSDGR